MLMERYGGWSHHVRGRSGQEDHQVLSTRSTHDDEMGMVQNPLQMISRSNSNGGSNDCSMKIDNSMNNYNDGNDDNDDNDNIEMNTMYMN